MGPERVPAGLSAVWSVRDRAVLPEGGRHSNGQNMSPGQALLYLLWFVGMAFGSAATLTAQANAAGPVIVVETTQGTFAFETYPRDAPKTVAHVVALVRRGFYDGQRVHRAVPGFLVQWGDPQSRDLPKAADWGRGPAAW